jgi:lon-related putative ATP-dependent protease
MPADKYQVPIEKLKKVCDYDKELAFCQSSADMPSLVGIIGQDRAVRSMQFGLSMTASGYNLFVCGPPGTGKSTYSKGIVSQLAATGDRPDDWVYLYNFADADRPSAVSLPAGMGKILQKDMDDLMTELRIDIPKSFDGSEHEQQKTEIQEKYQQLTQDLFHQLEEEAAKTQFSISQTPTGIMFIPMKDGRQYTPDEFKALPVEERRRLESLGAQLGKRLEQNFHETKKLEKAKQEEIHQLEKNMILAAAKPDVALLQEKYADFPKITEYLDAVLMDVMANSGAFKPVESEPVMMPGMPVMMAMQPQTDPFLKYKVNLFVNNETVKGAPVIIEARPSYYNLFGKIEYKSKGMAMETDFTMVKPGAIHEANGGYLILQAKDLLSDPFAWDALKKVLKHKEAVVENIGEQYRMVPAVTLRPEPIPTEIKIILIGSPLHYMICNMDEDFKKLYKVKVDFDIEMDRSDANLRNYVSFVGSICHDDGLNHFDRAALGRIVEYSSRLAGDQSKLSARFNEIAELVYEAAALAEAQNLDLVGAEQVEKAVSERKYRLSMYEEKLRHEVMNGKMLISTQGEVIGQINGLSVMDVGGYAFGNPSRMTARTYAGRGGVINIERETEMSGNIHNKGVLTLAGFLGGKFAQKEPLGMTAQITFEQNYGMVDGDSASSTELYAILSSLAEVPIRQDLAVTGSVDQRGMIQPIGGATQKIEGFFDVCNAKGLTGSQGVIIPAQNVDDLMLKDEVIAAVKDGQFHIYAVKTIEEGIELLTGVPAGQLHPDGSYSVNSIYAKAAQKLKGFGIQMEKAAAKTHKKSVAEDKNKK